MGRTGEKARSLVAEDPAFAEALTVVLDRAGHAENEPTPDGGTHTIRWADVSDDLTSGQWGRLIETGILYDADGDGFAVSEPESIREAIGDDSVETTVDEEDSGWSTYDKLAGLAAISFFPAYYFEGLRNIVGSTTNVLFGLFDAVLPFYAVVIILSVLTGLYSTLLQSNLMNTDKMGAIQEQMNDIQERRKAAKERGDDAALDRIQEEQMDAMGDQLGMFKEQFRPMVWIMLLTIPVFVWMYWKVGIRGGAGHIPAAESSIVLPLFGEMGWTDRIGGFLWVWLLWYFLISIAFRQIIQKSLNLSMTPTG
jgi:uncharacterized membrane protein (DUF106 family)